MNRDVYRILIAGEGGQGVQTIAHVLSHAAFNAGLQTDVTYTVLNGESMQDTQILTTTLSCSKPGDNITLRSADSTVMITLGENPNGGTNGYLGVTGIKPDYKLKDDSLKIPYSALFILANLLEWVFLLSLGIGLANLLPLGPVDGGRMLHTTLVDMKGKEKGTKIWAQISWVTFVVLIILVLTPIIKSVLFKI